MTTTHRPGARGGRKAKQYARDERYQDSIYERGVLTRPGEVRARVMNAAVNTAQVITIDDEFHTLIPPQTPEENAALEESLLKDGCNDALVIWQGHNILIDGHHRYALCMKHGIPFTTRELSFDSREDVIVWMVQHQLGRRNISAFVRSELALRMKSAVEAKAKANQAHGQTAPGKNASGQLAESVSTRRELAAAANVGERTLQRVENVTKNAPEPIKAKARSGEISVNRADLLTKALSGASPIVTEFVTTSDIDDLERVEILKRLEKSAGSPETNGTFHEIIATGGFHYGEDETERVTDFASAPIQQIQRGLDAIARSHAVIAAGAKEAELEAERRAQTLKAMHSSESNEWYTPSQYIDAARQVLGAIDLDPASCELANKTVKAAQFYSIEDDALTQEWFGRVWLNPPYGKHPNGKSNQHIWTHHLVRQYRRGAIDSAVLLVSANTDCRWFQVLWDYPMVFTPRINFNAPDGQRKTGPNHGSVLAYLGKDIPQFIEVMRAFGRIVIPHGAISEVLP